MAAERESLSISVGKKIHFPLLPFPMIIGKESMYLLPVCIIQHDYNISEDYNSLP